MLASDMTPFSRDQHNMVEEELTNAKQPKMSVQEKSNFQKVIDFNYTMGILPSREIKVEPDVIIKDPKKVEYCLKLIREEVEELEEAVKENDYVEMADALADILYVVYGMGARVGLDMDRILGEVHDNNMTKACANEQEAMKTVNYYMQNPKLGYDSPSYRQVGDLWVVYNKSTNKCLKSINYKDVDLKPLCS